ncbi:hypothetical protein PHK61_31675 [Actinomycetospora lutea]|uniref:hypothetical protein n=1 Tax=Actinomycetospora lutea TaxID=663604 RepID=UPI002365FB75|nr:hypothetical protein [Actinomycetospora lutea]MDD7942973.1 hypothetical protein [Actinomycetospora lutea]
MFAVIRTYEDEVPEIVVEVGKRAEALRDVMRGLDGFVAYYLVDLGDGRVTTIGVFDTRSGAEESTRSAGRWLHETGLAALVPNPPTITLGEVVLDAR